MNCWLESLGMQVLQRFERKARNARYALKGEDLPLLPLLSCVLRWTPCQVYSVVSDVDNYHKFVPWCIASRVIKKNKEGSHVEAELEVGFQLLREK
jgi:hypothetical protein